MSKLDKFRRNPLRFFQDAQNPAVRAFGQTAVKALRDLALNPVVRQLPRNPVKFFEEVENPTVRTLGLAATKRLPALVRVAESLLDPVSTTIERRAKGRVDGPLVSVVVAAHNTELTIARALESVLGQSYHNLEVIVVDDASTDGTADVVDEIAEIDPRILMVINRRLRGPSQARNQGMSMAVGKYVVFHDATAIAAPDRIERQVRELEHHASAVVCTVSQRGARGRTVRKAPVSMLFEREPVIDKLGYLRGAGDEARDDYYQRILDQFGDDAERALGALLYEAQAPAPTFEYSDREKQRVNPAYDERTSWPEPTWDASAAASDGAAAGDYVAYRPPQKRHVELHRSCRKPQVRPRILFA